MKFSLIPLAIAALVTAGCNNEGSSSTTFSLDGVFLDSAVSGITYQVGSKSGLTNSSGEYTYTDGGSITFSVGNIIIGSSDLVGTVTPLNLAEATNETDSHVTNIARFLQTIDDDANPDNGISITQAMRDQAANASAINFDQTIAAFEADANVLAAVADLTAVSAAGSRTLISAAAAQAHLASTLFDNMAGRWHGYIQYVDLQLSTFVVDVSSTGQITGTANIGATTETTDVNGNDQLEGTVTVAVSGSLNSSGAASFASAGGEISFSGGFNNTGAIGSSEGGWGSAEPITATFENTSVTGGNWVAQRD